MNIQRTPRWDRELTLVSQLAAAASLLSFLFYFRHGDLLLYGDAVAHINIARRVIDSRTPGLLQLGTVWLPLPHLLMIPFLLSDAAWQTGIAGAIPSMCGYVLGTVGIFRLVRGGLSEDRQQWTAGTPALHARAAAWLAAVIYAANPNLLYMQTTAMTEVLYLAFLVWSLVYFGEFVQSVGTLEADTSLMKCGGCLLAACLTRYDGWFAAGIMGLAAAYVLVRSGRQALRRSFLKFILLALAGPLLWLGYNAVVYHNPLEFANGPYSAHAIEQQKTALSQLSPHPGWHSLPVAFSYFLKCAEGNVAEGKLQKLWVALLFAGTAVVLVYRKLWPFLLLVIPVVFYPISIAYGSVPIYLLDWWPFSYYNVRFGLEMVPAFAVMAALVLHFLLSVWSGPQALKPASLTANSGTAKAVPLHGRRTVVGDARNRHATLGIAASIVALIAVSYALVWRAQPICYREAWFNSRTRMAFEAALAATLIKLPHDSSLLMYLGDHVGALQDAGIPLRRTINESNHRPWREPYDPDGLWERALDDPKKYVEYVIAIDDDPVATKAQRRDLSSMVVVHTIGQPPATIYWTGRITSPP